MINSLLMCGKHGDIHLILYNFLSLFPSHKTSYHTDRISPIGTYSPFISLVPKLHQDIRQLLLFLIFYLLLLIF